MDGFMQQEMELNAENRMALLGSEDSLDYEFSPVDSSTGGIEIEECNTHLAINGNPINHLIATIDVTAMDTLYWAAVRLRNNTLNYVTGVKLSFGVQDGGVILIFQPLYMTTPPGVIPEPFYNVTGGLNYIFNSDTKAFEEASDSLVSTLTADYRSMIRIKHRTDRTFTSYIPNADTDAVIFPFQTIYALINDNVGNVVHFHNAIRKEPVGGAYSIQHAVLLSSQYLLGNSFEGKYANRSHLCPPSCNKVQYAVNR